MSTSAGQEDHVSMGCFAARKALQVLENVENVIAIELLAACQAIEFLRPLRTTTPLEEVYATVRSVVQPWDKDRFMSPDIEAVRKLLVENKIWNVVQHYLMFYHAPQVLAYNNVVSFFLNMTFRNRKLEFLVQLRQA